MCSKISDDGDWIYSCATGIYMVALTAPGWGTPNFWDPCLSNKYPAACFRFKTEILFITDTYPCSFLYDVYTERGCVWGHGFLLASNNAPTNAQMVCDIYHRKIPEDKIMVSPEFFDYLSCLDGYYHNSFWQKDNPAFVASCHKLPFEEAKSLCLSYAGTEKNLFNAKETPWFNWSLLEENLF